MGLHCQHSLFLQVSSNITQPHAQSKLGQLSLQQTNDNSRAKFHKPTKMCETELSGANYATLFRGFCLPLLNTGYIWKSCIKYCSLSSHPYALFLCLSCANTFLYFTFLIVSKFHNFITFSSSSELPRPEG